MHTPDWQHIMSILHTVKTFCANSNKGKRNEQQSKHTKTVWLQRSHGKHIEKRIFRQREGPVMRLQGLGTRRRPCASRLNTHAGAPCLRAEVLAVCWVLKEATAERTWECHLQLWRVITSVSSPYIPTLTYISLLLLIQPKTTLLIFTVSHLESYCMLSVDSPASSAYTEKNYEIFLWMDMKHWNVALPRTD